jgi:CheY-like chemotaxis protein
VLVVEDELVVAVHLQDALRKAGAQVVIAGYLEAGLYMGDNAHLSAAVVDLNLGKGDGTRLCQRLHYLHIPFIVHTAYSADEVQERWPDVPIIRKPARTEQIIDALLGSWGHKSEIEAATRNKVWAHALRGRTILGRRSSP